MRVYFVLDEEVECHSCRRGQHGHELARAFGQELPVTADDAARHIVGAHHEKPLKTVCAFHLGLTEESKSAGIVPVLSIHGITRPVGLIFDCDKRLVEREQFIILVGEHIFVGKPHVTLALKQWVFGRGSNDAGAIHELLVAPAAALVKALQGGALTVERRADDFSVGSLVQSHDARHLVASMLVPERDDALHGIVGHPIVAVDTGVEFGVYVAVGRVVRSMHALVLLVDVGDGDAVLGFPFSHQVGGAVGGAVVDDKPAEVLTRLPAQTLVGAPECVRSVIGRSENGERGAI